MKTGDSLHAISKIIFWENIKAYFVGKIKKNSICHVFNVSCAEFAHNVVRLNIYLGVDYPKTLPPQLASCV